jgi:hypothetical protein
MTCYQVSRLAGVGSTADRLGQGATETRQTQSSSLTIMASILLFTRISILLFHDSHYGDAFEPRNEVRPPFSPQLLVLQNVDERELDCARTISNR